MLGLLAVLAGELSMRRVVALRYCGDTGSTALVRGSGKVWLSWRRFTPLSSGDDASQCCAPHHAIGAAEHDAWAALAGESTATPVLEAGEAVYLRLHFAKEHPDRRVIQRLLSPRCLADQQARQSRYSLYLSTAGSVTNLHYDNFDGLLHQLTGRKSIALWAPADARHLRMCGERCASRDGISSTRSKCTVGSRMLMLHCTHVRRMYLYIM